MPKKTDRLSVAPLGCTCGGSNPNRTCPLLLFCTTKCSNWWLLQSSLREILVKQFEIKLCSKVFTKEKKSKVIQVVRFFSKNKQPVNY